MKKEVLTIVFLFFAFYSNNSFTQTIIKKDKIDPAATLMEYKDLLGIQNNYLESPFYNESLYNSTIYIDDEDLEVKKNQLEKTALTPPSDFYQDNAPSDILDKYNLKPSPGSLSEGLPNFSEDLHYGKVNVSIPLFNFEYYNYKIPVFINNMYPQTLVQPHGEPTFYTTSNVGGDWSLSVNQFKVTRRVNGIEDEHPTKGYFSSLSQNKVNNPSSISNNDVHTGLKGDWDPAIDVFHFSTPTISGSFLININTGSCEVLSKQKFHINFELVDNKLHKFIITDNNGIKYVFGGDTNSIEVSQSITDVYSYGRYKDGNYNKVSATHIIELINGVPQTYSQLGAHANFFVTPVSNGPTFPPSSADLFNIVLQNSAQRTPLSSSTLQWLTPLGSTYDSANRVTRKYYAITGNQDNTLLLLPNGKVINDPEMRREKLNTGWYLKEILLLNGKKINFSYYNSSWEAYRTFAANKIKINMLTSTNSNPYNYIGLGGFVGKLINVDLYACFPEQLSPLKFPINESHSVTTHFVKKPSLWRIADEDNFSQLSLFTDIRNQQPYVGDPEIYPNAPSETIFNGAANYGLLSQINFTVGGEYQTIKFFNRSIFHYEQDDEGQIYYSPWKDRSFLDEIIINGRKRYYFEYGASRLEKIHYPTGGIKEFFSTNNTKGRVYYNVKGNLYSQIGARVDSIITISENNKTTEKYSFSSPRFNGVYSTLKTFRPEVAPCLAGATMTSTSPIFQSTFKDGLYFVDAKKFINNKLMTSLEYSGGQSIYNLLTLTDETSPDYLTYVKRPRSPLDEKQGLVDKSIIYKTEPDGTSLALKESAFTRTFEDPEFKYPSVYLTKIEAGPWQNTNGAIKRGYSTYHYPLEYNLSIEKKIDKDFFDGGNFIKTENETYFKRTKIPALGLNIYRPYWNKFYDTSGDLIETKSYSPIEIEGLQSSNSNVVVKNSIFRKLLSNNRAPNLETISFNKEKIVGVSSSKFGLTPVDLNGKNFAVVFDEKMLELDNTVINQNNFTIQSINSSNPEEIIFDNNLKNKVHYDKYDKDGQVLEYHSLDDGMYTSIIWGNKKQLPIAIIYNARYSDVESHVANIQYYSNSRLKTSLINALNNLRTALPNAQIKTYIYEGKKVSEMTDEIGQTTYYEYNDFEELEVIKNTNGEILEKYSYNYKTLSNFTRDFKITSINWLNPRDYLIVGNSLSCTIGTTGGSGDYTYSWVFKKNGTVLSSGNDNYAYLYLSDQSFAGSIDLTYEVTDNYTGITLTKSRSFYVNAYAENQFTLNYENIRENLFTTNTVYTTANVTSTHADTLRFWVFNMSTDGAITVIINGGTYSIGHYETKTIEVPVQAGQTISCSIHGSGNFNFAMLEILKPLHGTANPISPNVLNLNK